VPFGNASCLSCANYQQWIQLKKNEKKISIVNKQKICELVNKQKKLIGKKKSWQDT